MKQNFDAELSKVDGKLNASTSEAKAQCREFIGDNNRAIKEQLDKIDKFENIITDIKEHFEETKDNKDKVDKEIQDIKEKMAQLTVNAQSAPPEGRQPLTVHYGQGGERSVDEKLHELDGET